MLTVTNLHKRHGELQVLRGVSLALEKGRVAVLIGPSGSGKSTVLRCINGLEPFESGEIDVGGRRLTSALPPHERQARLQAIRQCVGMVFQQFHLFPHLSVLENVIEAPLHVLKTPREQAVNEARALLDRVGLGDRLDSRPHQLSGGQQQRVAIARSLAMRPELILFDEPTSALDPQMTAEVEAVMADLASGGQTMLVVTHAMEFARRIAHQVHTMMNGTIVIEGSADIVFASERRS
ncbi:MAG: amino acid ABC transporter ATP-binding protein [Planctomycetaceae bacterium]